jgi:hypothetical protein
MRDIEFVCVVFREAGQNHQSFDAEASIANDEVRAVDSNAVTHRLELDEILEVARAARIGEEIHAPATSSS